MKDAIKAGVVRRSGIAREGCEEVLFNVTTDNKKKNN